MSLNRTPIEWALNPDGTLGYTWNPITGCLNGCEYCYARKLANGRLKNRYLAKKTWPLTAGLTDHPSADPFYPRFWSDRCNRADMGPRGKPKGIFVCDMSDLFGIGIPEDWTHRVLDRCKDMEHHRFYLLTKQPQNLIKWSPFPENAWVGVTATDQEKLYWAVEELVQIEAKVKYLSLEPLLEWVSPTGWLIQGLSRFLKWGGINQVIIGACTGQPKELMELQMKHPALEPMRYGNKLTLQPRIEWVQEIEEAARKAGIAIFEKDNLKRLLQRELIQEHPQ